jgi:hypothetical protein
MITEALWQRKLFKITHKTVVFFTVFQCLLFVFYLAGIRNLFLDSTLLFILRINTLTSTVLVILLFFYLIQIIALVFLSKRIMYLCYVILCAASFASALALAIITRSLVVFSRGFAP